MMAEEQTTTTAAIYKARNDYNLLQIRLDTSSIIEQVRMYLNSEIEVLSQDKEGNYFRKVIPVGQPKANKTGTAAILMWVQMIVNPHVVQGNFPVDKYGNSAMYDRFIEECQKDLGDLLMINLNNYDLEDDEFQGVIDSIMNIIKPFMTRLLGNEERKSYGETFKQIESTNMKDMGRIPFLKK